MEVIRCQCDGEIFESNLYNICFQTQVGVPLLVEDNGEWCPTVDWEPLKNFEANLLEAIKAYRKSDQVPQYTAHFYAGVDFMAEITLLQLVCAIARDPFGEHSIRRLWGDYWGDWKLFQYEYFFIRTVAKDVEAWPDFDRSNPDITSRSETSFQIQLGGYDPNSLTNGSFEAASSASMTLQPSFTTQFRKQLQMPMHGAMKAGRAFLPTVMGCRDALLRHIQTTLLTKGEIYLPYIGRWHMKDSRLCFSAARLLRDRIHGRDAKAHRIENNRCYGGEKQPGQSVQIWGHRGDFQLSRVRQLINAYSRVGRRGNDMVVYQAFADSVIFRLAAGETVSLKGIGTLRVNPSKRLSFRTSKAFRQAFKEHQGQSSKES